MSEEERHGQRALENENPDKDTQEDDGEGGQTILYREPWNKTQPRTQRP